MEITKQVSVSVTNEPWDDRVNKDIQRITLRNEQVTVEVINLGCAVTAIYAPDKNGIQKNIVAGFPDVMEYEKNNHYLGCIIGRHSNRIAGAAFSINGNRYQLSQNDGTNHLHGGVEGFNKKLWTISSLIQNEQEAGVLFEYLSKDGEEGYPGNLQVKVSYVLNDRNQLRMHYTASTDKSTPVSLTNHSYFNLTGFDTPHVLDHILFINAHGYTPKKDTNTPAGHIENTDGTALNFFTPKTIGKDINCFPKDKGFDQTYVLAQNEYDQLALAAELTELQTGRILKVYTDQPAMQLYTANLWDGSIKGRQQVPYQQHGAVALETQAFTDNPNQPLFPSSILDPGKTYSAETIYEFGIQDK
jgi:aldose 1-epimerase